MYVQILILRPKNHVQDQTKKKKKKKKKKKPFVYFKIPLRGNTTIVCAAAVSATSAFHMCMLRVTFNVVLSWCRNSVV